MQAVKDRWRRHKAQLQREQDREARRLERQYLLVGPLSSLDTACLIWACIVTGPAGRASHSLYSVLPDNASRMHD